MIREYIENPIYLGAEDDGLDRDLYEDAGGNEWLMPDGPLGVGA